MSATPTERSAVWGCDGVASVRAHADSLYANGILSSFPFVGTLAAAMDKAAQRGRKWAHCRSEGRKEGGRDPKMSSLAPSF